jgi:hypothetical protein
MPALWNSFSTCLRAPREIHISDSAAYFTGVAKSDRISVECLDLLNRGHVIPLGFTPPAQLNVFDFLFNRGAMFTPPTPHALPVVAKRTSRYRGSVSQNDRTGVGSGNPTGVNSFSACLGGRNDRTSVECLNLVHRGGVITLREPYFTGES